MNKIFRIIFLIEAGIKIYNFVQAQKKSKNKVKKKSKKKTGKKV
jgi:hypothetical protein